MKKHYRHENDCLNCGAQLQGHFCHVCGQENLQIKENFGHLMQHAIGDYFHFDEKFFHTLKPLLFSPGKLTVDYIAGKRTQYLHPIRMYIFISLVFFLLVFSNQYGKKTLEQKRITKDRLLKRAGEEVADLKKQLNDDKDLNAAQKAVVNQKLQKYQSIINANKATKDTTISLNPLMSITESAKKDTTENDTTYVQYLQSQQKLSADKRDGFLMRHIKKRTFELKSGGMSAVEAISESMSHNFPKMMFLLLPLFAFILRITFWKSHKYYVEHLIYAFHLHCFVFLFSTFIIGLDMLAPATWVTVDNWIIFLAVIIVLLYIYKSLRLVYQRGRWSTILKMIALSFTYMFAFVVCLIVLFIVIAAFA